MHKARPGDAVPDMNVSAPPAPVATPPRATALPALRTPDRAGARHLLGLLLPTVALAVAAAGLALAGVNRQLFLGWNGWAASWPPALWSMLSVLGNGAVLFPLFVWTLALRPRLIASFSLLLVIAGGASTLMKQILDVPRPAAVLAPEQIHIVGQKLLSHSVPSGHALTVFAVTAAVFSCARANAGWRALGVGALLLAVAVSFSRVAVGAHWPLDLLVGGAVGWACGVLSVAWLRRLRFWRQVWFRRVLAIAVAIAALSLFRTDLGYPLADPLKIAVGIFGIAAALPIAWDPRRAGRAARHGLYRRRRYDA